MKRFATLLAGMLVVGFNVASAQVLNFDGICTPPNFCAVGSAYAASGITFSPSSQDLWPGITYGDPGGWGIDGTNGSYFMGFNNPYNMQVNLARPATFISLDVTRTNGSVDGSFTLTLFNGATQVDTVTVPLGAINSWTSVARSVAGGFNIIVWSGAGTAFHPYAVDNIHIAGNCNGFSDVFPADSYCNAAEWLANRGVTLGCLPGQYCPAGNVTRAQMALFMNRLGDALTPQVMRVDASPGAIDLDAASPIIACQTADFVTNGYPRSAFINTTFAGQAAGALEYQHEVYVSTDGGATWNFTNSNINRNGTSGAHWTSSNTNFVQSLNVGTTYRWGVRLGRQSGTADFSSSRCFINVEIQNRTVTSAPFDLAVPRVQPDR